MLHQYIYHKVEKDDPVRGRVTSYDPIGVFVSYGVDKVGWALCKRGNKFDKEKGLIIAAYRALSGGSSKKFPDSLMPQFDKFTDRITRYFKPGFILPIDL